MTPETMENVRKHFRSDIDEDFAGDLTYAMTPGDGWLELIASEYPTVAPLALASLCDRHERAVRLLERVSDIEDYAQLASVASDIRTFIAEQEPNNV